MVEADEYKVGLVGKWYGHWRLVALGRTQARHVPGVIRLDRARRTTGTERVALSGGTQPAPVALLRHLRVVMVEDDRLLCSDACRRR